MYVFRGNLSGKTLKISCVSCTICKWPMISTLRFSENAPAYDGCSEWGRYKGNCRVCTEMIQRLFSWSSYDLRPNIIPASFFWVKCVRFSPCQNQDFTKRPGDFQRFPTNYRRLYFERCRKLNVRRCSRRPDVWALSKLLKRRHF